MAGMDLNQNNRDFKSDLLAERVNRIERFLDSFDLELVEPVEGADKIRVNKLRAVDGRIQQTKGREIDVGTGLDDGDATNRLLVWNTDTSAWEPNELVYPKGDDDNPYLKWDGTKWVKAAGTALDASTVDGHVLETYDDAGTKRVRWGFARMKDI